MATKPPEKPSRYPVRLSADAKRKMSVLAADAGKRIEDFGGQVLGDALDRLYGEYTKRIARELK